MNPTKEWLQAKLPLEREYVWKQSVAPPEHEYYNIFLDECEMSKKINYRLMCDKKIGDKLFFNGRSFVVTGIDHTFLVCTVSMI
jgi:hypothetical protein